MKQNILPLNTLPLRHKIHLLFHCFWISVIWGALGGRFWLGVSHKIAVKEFRVAVIWEPDMSYVKHFLYRSWASVSSSIMEGSLTSWSMVFSDRFVCVHMTEQLKKCRASDFTEGSCSTRLGPLKWTPQFSAFLTFPYSACPSPSPLPSSFSPTPQHQSEIVFAGISLKAGQYQIFFSYEYLKIFFLF